jgi:DNA repair photolyase
VSYDEGVVPRRATLRLCRFEYANVAVAAGLAATADLSQVLEMAEPSQPGPQGRGSLIRPRRRFEKFETVDDFEHLVHEPAEVLSRRRVRTQYLPDEAKSIVTENESPDVPFRYSMNPYRGCAHGCSYCYARPTHEYLGLDAGRDFESKIFVKLKAPELFREFLAGVSWSGEPITLSGVTDCYQPAERRYRLTRQCLEVAREVRQPLYMVTKNALVTRDLDILAPMAQMRLVGVAVSVTTLDRSLARVMEPRTSSPVARLRAISELAAAGVPTKVLVAPVIPGLNDSEIPAILEAARDHGAEGAAYVLLRLPLTVRPVFLEWLERTQRLKRARVEALIRSTRGGALNESAFGRRMKGTGRFAEQIGSLFRACAKRYGLDRPAEPLDRSQFKRPRAATGQLHLF